MTSTIPNSTDSNIEDPNVKDKGLLNKRISDRLRDRLATLSQLWVIAG